MKSADKKEQVHGQAAHRNRRDERKKSIICIFHEACYRHNRWTVWADFVVMAAISISNVVDKSHRDTREKMFSSLAEKYNQQEMNCFGRLLGEIVLGMDECPNQDLLGELYMDLELGNDHKGQFFTPYSICRLMAAMTFEKDMQAKIRKQGWATVNDPACGAGALLIAFANECRRPGRDVNYQTSILFTAQDIDLIAGCMCYIQLSLLGCPGYVVVADTITDPATSLDERGLIPKPGENIWYTPFYFREEWHYRRLMAKLDSIFKEQRPEADGTVLAEIAAQGAVEGQLTLL